MQIEVAALSKRMTDPKIVQMSTPHGGSYRQIDIPGV
jgi:hypothetical protein